MREIDLPQELFRNAYNVTSDFCHNYTTSYTNADESVAEERLVFFTLFLLSIIGLISVAMSIFNNKRL